MKDFLQKLRAYPVLVLFFVCIFGFMILDLICPDREISELENKKLQQRPAFSLSSLTRNEWTAKYGDYVKDQVIFRDGMISLQSRFETVLFQKCENNGVLIGDDAMLFTRMYSLTNSEKTLLPRNIQAVEEFASRHPGQVTFLLAPSASLIYSDAVPFYAPLLDEDSMLDDIFSRVPSAQVLDLRTLFGENRDQYLYYRTDHHWTTNGAYLAYEEFCRQQGLTPFDREAHTAVEVPNFYGTSYSSSRYWGAVPDVITYYELDNPLTVWNLSADGTKTVLSEGDMYDYAKFDTYDKYAAFMRGNNGYSTIEGDGEGSILVIKDSYANCFIPFLTANYDKIGVVDLRNYNLSIDDLMESEGYDQVLILYNFQSFKSDARLPNLNR